MHYRHLRVAELIREALSVILMDEVRDPDLQGFITISEVEVSPDLRRARVYYRVHGEEEDWKRAERGFQRARRYLRHLLGQHVYLRYLPDLSFHPDRRPEDLLALSSEGNDADEED
ncbi:MAG TPA: 30S ribosome-binding factor RbfA [Thermosulfurimonas dismutans]|uniref:Ribosome-binding factor A n=1 Tax=Thermosulfurimonas dismutans TaxID=999894 RepID=A0A7C3CMT9_9BACT|nr:30S ribosome-binding factor RbfA [Thermosulfurimonas dismutans]